jgi:site-specific DNA-methyltransferase (adenine-specific)
MKERAKINMMQGDCMDLMKDKPDNYYSLCIVDPPYGIGAPKQAATPCQRAKGANRLNQGAGKLKDRVLNQSNCEWDNAIPKQEYFDELFRVSINQIIWGGNYFPLPPTRCIIAWDKAQPWENFSQFELAWTSFDSPAQLFKFDNRTGDKIHPTQKPIALYKWLLQKYAKEGDKIFDSHGGSGSICIACWDLKFDLDWIELDADYYKEAVARVERHKNQLQMF